MEKRAETRLELEEKLDEQPLPPPAQEEPVSRAQVVFSVLFYIVAAIIMVMVNKAVLNAISLPLFFLFCQLAIAVVLLQVSALLGYFTLPKLQVSTAKAIAPLIAINCTGLIFNTYCLKFVDASFYQIARGLVLPLTVLFSTLLLNASSSRLTLGAVALVCVGFFWGVSGETLHASRIGVVLGIFSSITTSVHAIVIKRSLSAVQGSTLDLVYYNNALSALVIAPLVFLSGESSVAIDMFLSGGQHLRTFVVGTFVTGIFGFLICVAGFLSIKVTSPVSHMISAAIRGVIQTFLGMSLFGDLITSDRLMGIAFILGGSILYTWSKAKESAKSAIQLPASPATSPMSNDTLKSADSVVRGLASPYTQDAESLRSPTSAALEKTKSH